MSIAEDMKYRKRYWKCPMCRMTERKEPHWSLGEHMEVRHNKVWNPATGTWVEKQKEPTP